MKLLLGNGLQNLYNIGLKIFLWYHFKEDLYSCIHYIHILTLFVSSWYKIENFNLN